MQQVDIQSLIKKYSKPYEQQNSQKNLNYEHLNQNINVNTSTNNNYGRLNYSNNTNNNRYQPQPRTFFNNNNINKDTVTNSVILNRDYYPANKDYYPVDNNQTQKSDLLLFKDNNNIPLYHYSDLGSAFNTQNSYNKLTDLNMTRATSYLKRDEIKQDGRMGNFYMNTKTTGNQVKTLPYVIPSVSYSRLEDKPFNSYHQQTSIYQNAGWENSKPSINISEQPDKSLVNQIHTYENNYPQTHHSFSNQANPSRVIESPGLYSYKKLQQQKQGFIPLRKTKQQQKFDIEFNIQDLNIERRMYENLQENKSEDKNNICFFNHEFLYDISTGDDKKNRDFFGRCC